VCEAKRGIADGGKHSNSSGVVIVFAPHPGSGSRSVGTLRSGLRSPGIGFQYGCFLFNLGQRLASYAGK
jgi:hypothetical protein